MSDVAGAPENPGRRSFVLRAIGAIAALIGAALGVPLAGFGASPILRSRAPFRLLGQSVTPTLRAEDWASAGLLEDFEVGRPHRVVLQRRVVDGWVVDDQPVAAYVLRTGPAEAVAFDPHCTHLGCPLSYVDGAQRFICPCHGGAFDASGNVAGGPPPRPLWRYATSVQNGEILIGPLEI